MARSSLSVDGHACDSRGRYSHLLRLSPLACRAKAAVSDRRRAVAVLFRGALPSPAGYPWCRTRDTAYDAPVPHSRIPAGRPTVSFVATSRNDNHGLDLLGRMQHFIDGLDRQCRRHGLTAELVLVEWNPPSDAPPLDQVLQWPPSGGLLGIRIITVPPELHARFAHSEALPLFQMIAKNVGIRRSLGEYICATNIDILMSDGIFAALKRLRPECLYRADRHDVEPHPPRAVDFDEIQRWCRAHTIRKNERYGTWFKEGGVFVPVITSFNGLLWKLLRRAPRVAVRRLALIAMGACQSAIGWIKAFKVAPRPVRARAMTRPSWRRRVLSAARHSGTSLRRSLSRTPNITLTIVRFVSGLMRRTTQFAIAVTRSLRIAWIDTHALPHLHTNGCGDFTLLSAEDWARTRAYPEWPIFSWHLDSVFLHYASALGIQEIDIDGQTAPVWHLEHAKGSGYVPGYESALFSRLEATGVPYLTSEAFAGCATKYYHAARSRELGPLNDESWGLAECMLAERWVTTPTWTLPHAANADRLVMSPRRH